MWNGTSIRCKLTTDSVLNGFQTDLVEVRDASLGGPVGLGQGWNNLDFSRQDFLWDGHSNLVIEICFGGQTSGQDIPVRMTDVGFDANAYGNYVDSGRDLDLGCKQSYKNVSQKRPNIKLNLTPAFANTSNFLASVANTAPALADLNSDGYVDMIVGNQAGGLNYFEGKVYDVGASESTKLPVRKKLEVYPNPGNGNFKVLVSNHGQAQLSVFDLTGKLILTQALNEAEVDISNQPRGIYLFVLNDGQQLVTQKVIVQ